MPKEEIGRQSASLEYSSGDDDGFLEPVSSL